MSYIGGYDSPDSVNVTRNLEMNITIPDSLPPTQIPPTIYQQGYPPPQGSPPQMLYSPHPGSPRLPEKSTIASTQPQPSVPMQVAAGGNKNAMNVQIMGDGFRDWSFDLFDCFADLSTCLLATISPCYIYSRNRQRFTHLEMHGLPLQERVEAFNHDCVSHGCLQVVNASFALQAISRFNVRRRYRIRGNEFGDVLASGLCIPCQLVQEHREISLEEMSFAPRNAQ